KSGGCAAQSNFVRSRRTRPRGHTCASVPLCPRFVGGNEHSKAGGKFLLHDSDMTEHRSVTSSSSFDQNRGMRRSKQLRALTPHAPTGAHLRKCAAVSAMRGWE